ncbi:MAG: hypothetical protein J6E31_07610, partial [Pyramidobacter sp.]|nr:hypothetical protein [Pyramidobacter sp.]
QGGRAARGLPAEKGPRAVVTELGMFCFGEDRRMYLAQLFPGVTAELVVANTGFAIDVSRAVPLGEPDPEVLRILTEKVDPSGLMS